MRSRATQQGADFRLDSVCVFSFTEPSQTRNDHNRPLCFSTIFHWHPPVLGLIQMDCVFVGSHLWFLPKVLSSSRAPRAASSEDQITRGHSFPQLILNVFPPMLWDSIKTPFCLWRRPGGLDKATQSKQHWRGWSAALQGPRLPNGALEKETRCYSAGPEGGRILGGLQRSLHRTLRWCSFSPDCFLFCLFCAALCCICFS